MTLKISLHGMHRLVDVYGNGSDSAPYSKLVQLVDPLLNVLPKVQHVLRSWTLKTVWNDSVYGAHDISAHAYHTIACLLPGPAHRKSTAVEKYRPCSSEGAESRHGFTKPSPSNLECAVPNLGARPFNRGRPSGRVYPRRAQID